MLVAYAPADGLDRSLIQLGEVHVEQRGLDVKLDAEWPIAQQEVKGQDIHKIGAAMQVPQSADGDAELRAFFNIHGSDKVDRNSM